jgi:hypothetical protein
MSPTSPKPLKFKKSINVLSGSTDVSIEASAPKDPVVALALLNNKPFPKTPIVLGKVEVGVSSGKEVSFGSGNGKASFSGGAGVFGALGVYKSPQAVFNAAAINEEILPAVGLQGTEDKLFLLLRSGYRLNAGAKGSIALAPGLTAGAEVSAGHRRAYAVIRAIQKDTGSRDAIQDVLDSWRLPRQVDKPGDLRPGTWLIAEVDSSFAMGLKAEYGYTYNWVKAAELGGLSGDIGLKIQLGVSTSLGFNTSGKYAVVIARESLKLTDRRLRMRLYRLSSNGWNFAFDAAAAFQADTSDFLPGQGYDKFIAGVLGLDPGQLVDDLRRWTDPANSLPDLIAGETIDMAEDVLTKITGVDAKAEFNKAKGKLQGLLKKWDELPNEVASRIWAALDLPTAELAEIAEIANKIKNTTSASAKKALNDLIAAKLEDVDFFDTAIGKWLLTAALGEPLKLIAAGVDSKEFKEFQKVAGLTASILDGSALQDMLGKLHGQISEMFKIDEIRKGIDEATYEKYEDWLKAKLSQFLGEEIDFAKFDKVRKSIKLLDDKAEEFYQKTIKLINDQYVFSFAYRYQSTTTKTALLDFTFDYRKGDPAAISQALQKVLKTGDFNDLLTKKQAGVQLHMAALTHGIERQASVDLTMPFIHDKLVSRSQALAKLDAVDDDDGRLLMYSLDAENKVTRITNRGSAQSYRASTFAIAAELPVRPGNVRVHSARSLTQSYAYEVAEPAMTVEDLVETMDPYATAYFPAQFGSPETRFSIWAKKLDQQVDANLIAPNGDLLLGNTLIRLKVELPGTMGGVWFEGPTKRTVEPYLKMSLRMQRKLRQLMVFYFFADPENFERKKLAAHALLMYAAVPPSNGVAETPSGGLKRTNSSIHWDWGNDKILRLMMRREGTTVGLTNGLRAVQSRLARLPNGAALMDNYATPRRIRQTLQDPNPRKILKALFRMESIVTNKAVDAAVHAANFRQKQDSTPTEALEALAEFGVAATQAFNEKLSGATFGDGPLRPLGSLLYVEALRALGAPGDGSVAPLASLRVEVLQTGIDIPSNFPDNKPLEREQLAAREMILNV